MSSSTVSLKKFFLDAIKPHTAYVLALLATGVYWGISNSLTPYVLKLIIDHVVEYQGDKAEVVSLALPYVILYIGLWILIAIDMRLVDWLRLRLFPAIRADHENMFAYLNRHSHQYFQNNFAGSLSNKISDMMSGMITVFRDR